MKGLKVLNVVFSTETASGGAVRAGLMYGDVLAEYVSCVNAKMAGENDNELLEELNIRNPVVKLPQRNSLKKFLGWLPFPQHNFNIFGTTDFSELDLESFDVVHMHNPVPFYGMKKLAKLCLREGVPYVITTHGTQNMVNMPRDMKMNYLSRLVFNNLILRDYLKVLENATALFALSKKGLELLKELFPRQKLFLTANGIRTEDFEISQELQDDVKNKFGINSDIPKILYVGKINRKKGADVLLDAVDKLDMGCQVLLVGPVLDSKMGKEIRERVASNSRVKLLGYVSKDDLIALYKLSDIYVLPSYSEISPLSIREAMTAGKPVVATDIPGNNELVVDGESGHLFKPGDSTELSKVLESLIGSSERRIKMGKEGKRIAKSEFDWNVIVESNIEAYGEIFRN